MTFRNRFLIHLVVVILASWLNLFPGGEVCAGDLSPELRRQIVDAGMVPWIGRQIPLDEALRGPNREEVSLRQLVSNGSGAAGWLVFARHRRSPPALDGVRGSESA